MYSCKTNIKNQHSEQSFAVSDSILLKKYENQIIGSYIDVDEPELLSEEKLNELLWENRTGIAESKVTYAPDNSFKIFTLEVHGCGAYCNPSYYSWIHYNLKEKEIIRKIDFETIDTIYKLPDNKYLIIDSSWARPASVMTVGCVGANLISFSSDSLVMHSFQYPEKYRYNEGAFGFCQENGVEDEETPYVNYDKDKKTLNYKYGNNYAYSYGVDIDTIRTGYFKYKEGEFILEEETIKVNNREKN